MWRREGKGEDSGSLFPHPLSCQARQAITKRESTRAVTGSDLHLRKIPLAALVRARSRSGHSRSGQMWWWPRIDEQQRDGDTGQIC